MLLDVERKISTGSAPLCEWTVLGNPQEIWSNPAAPISNFTMASSERCKVSATLVPAPGLAE